MASVNLCDREGCKAMVQGRALGVVAVVTSSAPGAERIEREICPGCVADLVTILETEPVTPRDPAYREPWERPDERDPMDAATSEQLAAALLTKLMQDNSGKMIEGTAKTRVDTDSRD